MLVLCCVVMFVYNVFVSLRVKTICPPLGHIPYLLNSCDTMVTKELGYSCN